MIYLLLCFIILLAVYLGCRLFLLRRSIARAADELKDISDDLENPRILKVGAPDGELERLLEAVNQNLQAIRSQYVIYRRKEQDLREQIENVSHDLRTPLTAILGYMKMMDRQEMTEQDREFLDIAVRKSHTLQNLTAQFYELSRVEDENFRLKLEMVDVGRILRQTCLDHYGLIETSGIKFETNFREDKETQGLSDMPVYMQGNVQGLERIFSNLLQNSVRYAKSELKICLVQAPGEGKIRITFENDIEPDQKLPDPSRLFERFYMQEQSRSRGGTGLGLTISKCLTERMNGTIKAFYREEGEMLSLVFELDF